jgi:hypothetical protein
MIDLSIVVQKHPYCLSTRRQLSALLHDLYPTQKRDVNIVLAVYDCGIVSHISKMNTVDLTRFRLFIKIIMDEYGLQEKAAAEGLFMWAKAYGLRPDPNRGSITKREIVAFTDPPKNDSPHVIETIQKTDTSIIPSNTHAKPIVINQTNASDFFVTQNERNEFVISKYRGFDLESISIPSSINGVAIKGISKNAFAGMRFLENVIIEEGIEYIGESAFLNCQQLTTITIPNSIKKIDGSAFENTGIVDLTLSSQIEYIGDAIFRNCIQLKHICIKSRLIHIPPHAFEMCTSLENIEFPDTVKGTITIGTRAFSNCSSLTRIVLPMGLVLIHCFAFVACKKLTEVVFPASLEEIEEFAFYGCNLKHVVLDEGLKTIGGCAFRNNKTLQWILLPNTLSHIKPDTHFKTSDLYEKKLPSTTATIYCYSGSYALAYARAKNYPVKDAKTLSI